MTDNRWYADGIRFGCTGCGDCCRCKPNEVGYVYLNGDDIKAMATALDLDEAEFKSRYTQKYGTYTVILHPEKDCIFLSKDGRCAVYAARPAQCRTWPFWETNLKKNVWASRVMPVCPGAGKGKMHSAAEIERISGEMSGL